jgi:hypothetical protein
VRFLYEPRFFTASTFTSPAISLSVQTWSAIPVPIVGDAERLVNTPEIVINEVQCCGMSKIHTLFGLANLLIAKR